MEPADETEALVSVTEINLRLTYYHFSFCLCDQTFKPADFSSCPKSQPRPALHLWSS